VGFFLSVNEKEASLAPGSLKALGKRKQVSLLLTIPEIALTSTAPVSHP
jgi:hypothetical protein